jgi:hypothetical protein
MTWDEIVALGLALPGVELGTSYGRPALKLRGKMVAAGGKADDHFVLSATLDEIEMLKETDPACFFQTPHYEGWPGVLIRYESKDDDRVREIIERSRDWAAAKPRARSRKRK